MCQLLYRSYFYHDLKAPTYFEESLGSYTLFSKSSIEYCGETLYFAKLPFSYIFYMKFTDGLKVKGVIAMKQEENNRIEAI
jgi:hypothetical protein